MVELKKVADLIKHSEKKVQELKELEKYGINRTLNGFYYISHYYPLRAMDEVSPAKTKDIISSLKGAKFEAYIHFPYCEQICTFCHFYKKIDGREGFDLKEDEALKAVEKEMRMHKEFHGEKLRVRSLQIGGGTPSLISNQRLIKLLEVVTECLDIEEGAEIKTEIYPKFYADGELEEKLRILKDFGFTEIVIDLETGNKKSLDYLNRRNSSFEAFKNNIEKIVAAGFDSIISALIMGVPYETYDTLKETLDYMISVPEIKVINTFPLIVRETDPINKQMIRISDSRITPQSRDEMCVFARDYLREHGYTEGPIAYFHPPEYRPEQQSEKFECVNLIGFGISSFGYLNGTDWAGQYYNYCNQNDYLASLERDEFPIWRIGVYGQEERARRKVIFGLANVKTENLVDIEEEYGISIDKIYGKTFNALLRLDLIEIDKAGQGVKYTDKGLYRLEEIMYFLSSDFVKDRCDNMPDKVLDKEKYKELINQHYYVTITKEDRLKFEKFEAEQVDKFMHMVK
ncbi:MAG: radical SAM protein [Bacteroidota bacterium]